MKTRRWVLPFLALAGFTLLVIAGGVHWARSHSRVDPSRGHAVALIAAPLPTLTPSRFTNTGPDATYVGSTHCQSCHADEHASYLDTTHSRSFHRVDLDAEPQDGEFEHPSSNRHFRVYRQDGQLRHRESLHVAGGDEFELNDRPLAYRVGAGNFSRTYLAEVDGFLVQSPLTWFHASQAWKMSPGYDTPVHPSFRRTVGADCLYCHVGRVEPVGESFHRFEISEMAIGCERCHGPGSLHVAKHQADDARTGNEDPTIVNPRRLSRELAESICHQCHLESEGEAIVRGRRREDFRPGLAWREFCINYAPEHAANMTVTGHVEQLRQSRCYQKDERLTCVTCHDPHRPPDVHEKANHYRTICLSCHESNACQAPSDERKQQNDDCSHCHMPRSSTEVPHVALAHHRIGVHRAKPTFREPTEAHKLVSVLGTEHLSVGDQNRLLGLAYLRLYAGGESNPTTRQYGRRIDQHLADAQFDGVLDADMHAARALLGAARRDVSLSGEAADAALAGAELSPAFRPSLHKIKAQERLQAGHHAQAAAELQRLVELRLDASGWALLGDCRMREKKISDAIAAFEYSLRLDAAQPSVWERLAKVHQLGGDSERARECQEKARVLRANLPEFAALDSTAP